MGLNNIKWTSKLRGFGRFAMPSFQALGLIGISRPASTWANHNLVYSLVSTADLFDCSHFLEAQTLSLSGKILICPEMPPLGVSGS